MQIKSLKFDGAFNMTGGSQNVINDYFQMMKNENDGYDFDTINYSTKAFPHARHEKIKLLCSLENKF